MAEKPEFTPNPYLSKFTRLEILSNKGNDYLRQAFIKKWNSMEGTTEWKDTVLNKQEFLTDVGKQVYQNSSKIEKECLDFRSITRWYLPLLIESVRCLNADIPYGIFEDLKTLRKNLVKLAKPDGVNDQEYEDYWDNISALLMKIGVEKDEIDLVKTAPIESLIEKPEELEVDLAVTELKKLGNDAYKKDKFKKAIEFYTKALSHFNVPIKEVAILYSNRSAAYLSLGDISSAMENAKSVIHLNQTWWKGYYRLALACQAKKNYKLTLFYLLMTQQFHESPKNVDCEINYCKGLLNKKNKKDRYNPSYRKQITLAHRGRFKQLLSMFLQAAAKKETAMFFPAIYPPLDSGKLADKPKKNLSDYKPIYLEDMAKGCEHIYEGYILKLTLMEDPHEKLTIGTAIHSVAHDDRNTYQRLSIYGDYMPERDELLANFGFGTKISILNPYYRVALDGNTVIRVDDYDTVVIHHELRNPKICRYCGDENPSGKIACKDCKRCFYCNARCMALDSKENDHFLICDLAFAFPIPE